MAVANILRRSSVPTILCCNKTDSNELRYDSAEFYSLGLGEPMCVSAISGSGTGDLLDAVVASFTKAMSEVIEEDIPRIAL